MSMSLIKKYTTLFLCTVMICVSNNVFAQDDATVESEPLDTIAYKKSLKEKPLTDVIDAYYEHRLLDTTKASLIIRYLERNFLKANYLAIAEWKIETNDDDGAITSFNLAIKKAIDLKNDHILFNCYLKRGNYFFNKSNNEEALNNFLKALALAEEGNNIRKQITANNNIILIKIQVNDNEGAINLYLENLEKIKNSNNKTLEKEKLRIYHGLTKAYINLDRYDLALQYCEKGLQISIEKEFPAYQAYFYTFLGEIQTNQGTIDKAHNSFNKAYELIKKAGGNKILDIFLKLYVGKAYFFEKKYEAAIQEFLEGEGLIEKHNVDFLSIQELYVYLAKSYLALENVTESTLYFNKANDIDTKNDKTRALLNSRITQNTLEKLKEEIDTIQLKSKKTKYFYFSGILVLLLVIIGLLVFYKKQQQKNKKRFAALMNQLEEKRQKGKLVSSNEVSTNTFDKKSQKKPSEIDPKILAILHKLDEFEEKELFISKDSTLVEVAKKIQTNTTYLSKVINTHKEKSFTAYITDLRVDYAIERLSHDRKFRSFTIGAIAQEIGFKRSESFSKAFKVKTGLYPSYFIKEIEKQEDKDVV